ncbi:MAG: hypothetical protein COB46_13095 [Rhodospirillaceae bacterium]|nr:MAG: hypothetical protein COB46_13095 [Rhodospirillaceae bacterium]
MAEKADDEATMNLWVQRFPVIDWTPELLSVYPEKTATMVRISGLILVFDNWIAEIGYGLMEIPFPEGTPTKYFGWAKPEWTFVHTFMNGFHESIWAFVKKIDQQKSADGEASNLETLYMSTTEPDLSYEDAGRKITKRNLARREALGRVQSAIDAGYFLEAIAFEEAVISNCLYLYCLAKGIHKKETSLYIMLDAVLRKLGKDHGDYSMFDALNSWRRDRNHALHNFVIARSDDLLKSTNTFAMRSEKTAKNGLSLAKEVCSWYEREAPGFLTTSWPADRPLTH